MWLGFTCRARGCCVPALLPAVLVSARSSGTGQTYAATWPVPARGGGLISEPVWHFEGHPSMLVTFRKQAFPRGLRHPFPLMSTWSNSRCRPLRKRYQCGIPSPAFHQMAGTALALYRARRNTAKNAAPAYLNLVKHRAAAFQAMYRKNPLPAEAGAAGRPSLAGPPPAPSQARYPRFLYCRGRLDASRITAVCGARSGLCKQCVGRPGSERRRHGAGGWPAGRRALSIGRNIRFMRCRVGFHLEDSGGNSTPAAGERSIIPP